MVNRLIQNARTAFERGILGLLFVPFLALQLLAPGTMATADADGVSIVLCTQGQVVTVVLAADGTMTPLPETGDHDATEPSCIWSLTVDTAPDIQRLAGVLSAEDPGGTVAQQRAALRLGHVEYVRPPARAPPATV